VVCKIDARLKATNSNGCGDPIGDKTVRDDVCRVVLKDPLI
jgi:hypothetical protein